MILDRVGDRGVLTLIKRVIAPHRALQLGEFIDHFGDEIGLGEAGGLFGEVRIGTDDRGQFTGQGGDAFDLVRHRAQLLVEGHFRQLCGHVRERRLAVIVPEMAGIREAGREDAGIAGGDRGTAIGRDLVGNGDEFGDQLTGLRITHREIFLVRLHRQGDDFRRQVQEVRIHLAQHRHRPFHQAGDLGQQAGIFDQFKPGIGADLSGAIQDQRLTGGAVQQDMPLAFQDRRIVKEIRHREGPAAHAAMAFGGIRGRNAENIKIDDIAVKHAQETLQRTDPALGLLALAELHRFGPGEGLHHVGDGLGNHLGRGAARLFNPGDPEFALLVRALLALIQRRYAGPAQKAFHGLVRRADARALALFADIGGLHRQALHHQAETTRTGKGPQRGPHQTGRLEPVAQQFFQVGLGARLHAGRDFLAEDFKQEFGHCVGLSAQEAYSWSA